MFLLPCRKATSNCSSVVEFCNVRRQRSGAEQREGITVSHLLTGIRTNNNGATENVGVENAGADSRGGKCSSKPYGTTPNRDYIEKALTYEKCRRISLSRPLHTRLCKNITCISSTAAQRSTS